MSKEVQHRIDALFEKAAITRTYVMPKEPADRQAMIRRVAAGTVISPLTGLFVDTVTWDSLQYHERIARLLRTICQRHPDWILCGPSAAGAHNFSNNLYLHRKIHVVTRMQAHSGIHGAVYSHYIPEPIRSVTIDGMRVTDSMRTMLDCARVLDFENAMIICSAALRAEQIPNSQLQEYVEGHPRIKGIIRARYVAEKAEPLCENGGEVAALCAFHETHFKKPEHQKKFASPLDGHEIRPDYVWTRDDGTLIAGELDGLQKYTDLRMTRGLSQAEILMREKDRESELNMLGIDVVRFQMQHVRNKEALQQRLNAARVPHELNPSRSPFARFQCKAY